MKQQQSGCLLQPQAGRVSLTTLVLITILCTVLYFNPERPLRLIGSLLVTDQAPVQSDAIVVLLGGDSPSRVLKAYQLYTGKVADKIVFSSGFVDADVLKDAPENFQWDPPSAEIVRAFGSLGAGPADIRVVPASGAFDTSHELQSIAAYAKKAGWKRLTLVSSPSHTHRVSMIWRRVGGGIEADTVASDEAGYKEWWKHGRFRRAVAYEYVATVKEIWSKIVDWSYDSDHQDTGAGTADSEAAVLAPD